MAKYLGDCMGLPIPASSLIRLDENSFESRDFPFLLSGRVGFASQEVKGSDPLTLQTGLIRNKHDYNKIANPEDLFRIALFDRHLANRDRMEANFNILLDRANDNRIIAIDHVEIFRGGGNRDVFKPTRETDIGANVLRSDFGQRIMHFLGKEKANAILDAYFNNLGNMQVAFEQFKMELPPEWEIGQELLERCHAFLFNLDRNESIKKVFRDYLRYLRT